MSKSEQPREPGRGGEPMRDSAAGSESSLSPVTSDASPVTSDALPPGTEGEPKASDGDEPAPDGRSGASDEPSESLDVPPADLEDLSPASPVGRLAATVERLSREVRAAQAEAEGRALIELAKGVLASG